MASKMDVLVLCHGNICRSPLAAAVMLRAGLAVTQAGLKEPEKGVGNKLAPKKMRDWARENEGLDLSKHRSQGVTEAMLEKADLILYMDTGNMRRLERMWEEFKLNKRRGPVYSIARPLASFLAEPQGRIGDPMFQQPGTTEFLLICTQLVEASTNFVKWWNARQAEEGNAILEAAPAAEEVVVATAVADLETADTATDLVEELLETPGPIAAEEIKVRPARPGIEMADEDGIGEGEVTT